MIRALAEALKLDASGALAPPATGRSTFTVELFLRGTDDVRSRVLDGNGNLQVEELSDGNVYHTPTVFQLKAMLYYAGFLTERGAEPHRLDPKFDVWQLREPLDVTP